MTLNSLSTPASRLSSLYKGTVTLAAGEDLFDISTWMPARRHTNIVFDITAEASGEYLNRTFSGRFVTNYLGMGINTTLSGDFQIHLA